MDDDKKYTTISIKRDTLKRLYMLKRAGETYDQIMNNLIDGEVV